VGQVRDTYFGSHELQQRAEVAKTSSDRSFGFVFASFSVLLGALGLLHGTGHWPIWFSFAAVMLILALAAPKTLAPFNRAWTKLALLLHAIVSPLVLAALFYVCIAPIGFLMRLSGRDPLRRHYDPEAKSYWITRDPSGPQADTFRNQF
jgi:Saxitoxin biosynthesis operon protein SxtJ